MIKEKVMIAVLSIIVLGVAIFGTMYYFTDIRPILNGENEPLVEEPPVVEPPVNENAIYDAEGNEYIFNLELDENNIYQYFVTDIYMNQIISGMIPNSEDLGEVNQERFNINIENISSHTETTKYISVQYLEPAIGNDIYYNEIIGIVVDTAETIIEIGQGGKTYIDDANETEVPLASWDTDSFKFYYTAGCYPEIDQEYEFIAGNLYYLKVNLDGHYYSSIQIEESPVENISSTGGSC